MNLQPTATYLPALDGIRAFAIFIVFIGHQGFDQVLPGGIGVTLFFFLSGFLITNLLFAEYTKTGRIDLKRFYIRRLLRLYPALLFMLLVLTSYLVLQAKTIRPSELLAALFYFENYHKLLIDANASDYWILWSLAVEEHFYLVFPFLFAAMAKKSRWLIGTTALLVGLSLLSRMGTSWYYNGTAIAGFSTAYLTHNRFDSILTGCLTSMLLHSSWRASLLQFASRYAVYAAAVLLLVFSVVCRDVFFRQTFRYSLQGLSMALLFPPLIYAGRYRWANNVLSVRPLVFIGKLSYSIYLCHWIALIIFFDLGFTQATPAWIAGNVLLTAGLSLCSYYLVETPFLRLRKKFGSQQPPVAMRRGKINVMTKEKNVAAG